MKIVLKKNKFKKMTDSMIIGYKMIIKYNNQILSMFNYLINIPFFGLIKISH